MTNKPVLKDMSPEALMKTLKGWESLSRKEQTAVERNNRNIGETLVSIGHSKLALGEYLLAQQEIMEPVRMFRPYLRAVRFNKTKAYQYINSYRIAKERWHPLLLEEGMRRGISVIATPEQPYGKYTQQFKKLPPGKIETREDASKMFDLVEDDYSRADGKMKKISVENPRYKEISEDPEVLKMQLFKFAIRCLKKLPKVGDNRRDKARQREFLREVLGMIIPQAGIQSTFTIEPQAAPEEFLIGPGRPRKEENAA